eukprot:TRINITY_DN76935_c0_g1_i1.p1 TRINITY_DN76935_c0_g1~~TRINITY_DN76935_c0_g1_i1.p1  ORF type:complete len:383 (+),score=96.26 TRINITY_DN76935_c0_g1_i1:64-1149(+)
MAACKDSMATAPTAEIPEMLTSQLLESARPERRKDSDASTRSGSPSANSLISEDLHVEEKQSKGGLTWEALERELLNNLPPKSQFPPNSPLKSKCILGSCPKQRARPSTISLPSDASERTPIVTPASSSWSTCILGTPSRKPLPHNDASQRTPSLTGQELSFLASAMTTSPTKPRNFQMADASQRSPAMPIAGFLSTAGLCRSPAVGDASSRCLPSTPSKDSGMQVSTPASRQAVSPVSTPLSTAPAPSSPGAAAAAASDAARTAAAAKAAAETAAAAAASAAAAAKAAQDAAAAAAAAREMGDASQRQPSSRAACVQPMHTGSEPTQQILLWPCDMSGRHLSGKELEAQLLAAAPEMYED